MSRSPYVFGDIESYFEAEGTALEVEAGQNIVTKVLNGQ